MAGAEHDEYGDDGEHENDNGYEEAMKRLAVLKAMPVDSLTDAQRKEKLRLANRESARKMRRKQAEQLQAAEIQVNKLEQETADYLAKLGEGWNRFKEIKAENEMLRNELQALQALQASMPGGEENAEPTGEAKAEGGGAAAPGDGGSTGTDDAAQAHLMHAGAPQPGAQLDEKVGIQQGTPVGAPEFMAALGGHGGQFAG